MLAIMLLFAIGLFQLLAGVGGFLMLFAIYPTAGAAPGMTFNRASDFSRMKLEVVAARPRMMMWGTMVLAIGMMGTGILTLLEVSGLVGHR